MIPCQRTERVGEKDGVSALVAEERLDTQRIPHGLQRPFGSVPRDEGEGAIQALGCRFAPTAVRNEHELHVGAGRPCRKVELVLEALALVDDAVEEYGVSLVGRDESARCVLESALARCRDYPFARCVHPLELITSSMDNANGPNLAGLSALRHHAATMSDTSHRDERLGAARALVVDAAAAEAVGVLASAGVRCLLLRGPALAALLYDAPTQRPYVDVDLLVEPARLADAEAALARQGLAESPLEAALPRGRPQHAHTWRTPSGATVDLHQTLIGIGAPPATAWRLLSRQSETITLQGVVIEIPSVATRAVIVALHAAHHVDVSGQALDDLERALARLAPAVWFEAARLARELDAVDAFVAGLDLSARGRAELLRLGLDSTATDVRSKATGERSFHVAQAIAWLESTPGTRAKARFLRRRLLPSPRTMRQRSRLARHGPAGLALAYLARWLDAARHLPTAFGALRRMRR